MEDVVGIIINKLYSVYCLIFSIKFLESPVFLKYRFLTYSGGGFIGGKLILPLGQQLENWVLSASKCFASQCLHIASIFPR